MIKPRQSAIAVAAAGVAFEKGRAAAGEGSGGVEQVVLGELQVSLGKVIGSSAFDVLLARAVRLAQLADPALAEVRAGPRGALSGFGAERRDLERHLAVILSYFIELLVVFIGEDLTWRAISDVWPNDKNDVGSTEAKK
jgi:hypothetical protein